MNNLPNQTTEIKYSAPVKINIGDVFYMLEIVDRKVYHSICRVCGGTRSLTVNGVTFPCPQCDRENQTLSVHGYAIRRYRVCGISDEVLSDTWKPSTTHTVKIKIYTKTGKAFDDGYCRSICINELSNVNPTVELVEKSYNPTGFIFTDYALAVKCADAVTATEIKKVETYNTKNGTNYELPVFNCEHAKKSN